MAFVTSTKTNVIYIMSKTSHLMNSKRFALTIQRAGQIFSFVDILFLKPDHEANPFHIDLQVPNGVCATMDFIWSMLYALFNSM